MTATLPPAAPPATAASPSAPPARAPARRGGTHRSPGPGAVRPVEQLLLGLLTGLGVVAAAALAPGELGPGFTVVLLAFALAVVLLASINPVTAVLLLLVACFLRVALPVPGLPLEPFVLSFAGVLASATLALLRRAHAAPRLGPLEAVMVLYLVWNIVSALAPHELPAIVPDTGEALPVWRFILTGTMLPFALYAVGRTVFDREAALRRVLWAVVALTAYSAVVSVLQFTGPAALAWPRFVISDPAWPGRAVGVFNQPVVNGLLLVIGFTVAVHLATLRDAPGWHRVVAGGTAAAVLPAVYLTHTRAVWLAFALVLIGGALVARGSRTAYVLPLAAVAVGIAATWSRFTSADRDAGGVASSDELDDRLNGIATSLWAIAEKPVAGWGIGRFPQVNTYYHQQWSQDVEWTRGYGISSHENELGIAAELGLVGLALWLAVLVLLVAALVRALRTLPATGVAGRGLAVVALAALLGYGVVGTTVDHRFLDFGNALVFLLVGIAVGAADRRALAPGERSAARRPAAGRR